MWKFGPDICFSPLFFPLSLSFLYQNLPDDSMTDVQGAWRLDHPTFKIFFV